jgi:hypothetical protein
MHYTRWKRYGDINKILRVHKYENGEHELPEYRIWKAMKNRCYNPRSRYWKWYGNRIFVCERWLGPEGFRNFYADMGPRAGGLTLERIDNDGNYEPGNCKWATWDTQANNSRHNRLLTYDNRTQTISKWARELGVTPPAIQNRLKRGWGIERALSTRSTNP